MFGGIGEWLAQFGGEEVIDVLLNLNFSALGGEIIGGVVCSVDDGEGWRAGGVLEGRGGGFLRLTEGSGIGCDGALFVRSS